MLNAMGDMVAQNLFLDAPQGGPHGCHLGHDVDAVTVLFDHAGDASHLPLDAVQALRA